MLSVFLASSHVLHCAHIISQRMPIWFLMQWGELVRELTAHMPNWLLLQWVELVRGLTESNEHAAGKAVEQREQPGIEDALQAYHAAQQRQKHPQQRLYKQHRCRQALEPINVLRTHHDVSLEP